MKRMILCSSLLALVVGCSNDSSSSNSPIRPQQVADTGTVNDLLGDWEQACQAGEFTGGGFGAINGAQDGGAGGAAAGSAVAFQNVLEVKADTMTLITRAYPNVDCTGEVWAESRVEMDYDIENYVAGQNNEAQMKVRSAKVEMKSQDAASAANQEQLCGISNWSAGFTQDIEGTECLANMPQNGEEFTQILNYSNGQLTFGVLSGNGEQTPTDLGTIPFTRVAGQDGSDGDGQDGDDGSDGDQGDGDQGKEQGKDQDQDQNQEEQKQQEQQQQEQKQQEQQKQDDKQQQEDKQQHDQQQQDKQEQKQQEQKQEQQQKQQQKQEQQQKQQQKQEQQQKQQQQQQQKEQQKQQQKGQNQQDGSDQN